MIHRYFFVHMMKTGGTTLHFRLLAHFGRAAYPWLKADGPDQVKAYASPDHLRERLAARGDEIRLVMGHFPLRTTEWIGGPVKTFTLLRDPVERVLSLVRSSRKPDQPLEAAYDALRGIPDNHMTKMLTLSPEEVAALYDGTALGRGDLDRAKEALTGIDVVGLQERFEEFCGELADCFGWDLGEPAIVNASHPAEATPSLRARIARDNLLDLELYDHAQKLVGRRLGVELADR